MGREKGEKEGRGEGERVGGDDCRGERILRLKTTSLNL